MRSSSVFADGLIPILDWYANNNLLGAFAVSYAPPAFALQNYTREQGCTGIGGCAVLGALYPQMLLRARYSYKSQSRY